MVFQNSFNNIAAIAPEAMEILTNEIVFSSRVSHAYDKAWTSNDKTGKIGDTYNIRIPGFYTRVAGAGAVPAGYNDTAVPVTLKQYNASILFSSKEMRLNVDDFKRNVLAPLLEPLWEGMDTDGLGLLNSGLINQFAGTPGTVITNLVPFLNAKAVMEVLSSKPAGQDCQGILNPMTQPGMVGGLSAFFNPQKDISDIVQKGELGYNGGVHYATTANIPGFTSGTWGASTPVYSTGASDGGTSITTTGWASGTVSLKTGDVFTVKGVLAVNPANKLSTGQLQQFSVTANATDTTGTTVMSFSPAMYLTGPLQNVTNLPAASAPIYMYSPNGSSPLNTNLTALNITQSLAFYEDAFVLAHADLDDVNGQGGAESQRIRDPRTKITLRLTKWYDGIADQGILRGDLCYGWAAPRPGFACRLFM
jgi:hypothetical protein